MVSDITSEKNASKQLLENFERLKLAQVTGKIGSWEYSLATGSLWVSEEALKICPIPNEILKENITREVSSIITELMPTTAQPADQEPVDQEIEFPITFGSNSETCYLKLVVKGVNTNHNTLKKVVGVIQNISNLKKAEIALKETHAQLLHAEKLSAIGELSASIAHEFNNPLQGVMNVISGVQKRSSLPREEAELMQMAITECKRMSSLIKNLQDFNKPNYSRPDVVNLQAIIESLLLLIKKELSLKGLTLKTEYPDSAPHIKVIGDQIKQVFLNIIKNSIAACEQGDTITIKIDDSQKGKIKIYFIDTGHGIQPEHIDKVFNPFFTTKPDLKGTGLGLSVSYGIVKNHRGRIDVTSTIGEGTTFIITLPLDAQKND